MANKSQTIQRPVFDTRSKVMTPTKDGYQVYKEYNSRKREEAQARKLPTYMQSKFRQPNDGWDQLEFDSSGSKFSDGYEQKIEQNNSKEKVDFAKKLDKLNRDLTRVGKSSKSKRESNHKRFGSTMRNGSSSIKVSKEKLSDASEFFRVEKAGITSIASVASKPQGDRDNLER